MVSGNLYIIAIPIGNPDDITLRAIKTLEQVDVIICEEFKPARRFLKKFDLQKKELIQINEHNEKEESEAVLIRMLQTGESMGLISDCGTPVFSDPGHFLIRTAVEFGIPVVPIPGVSSLMTTLSVLNFQPSQFVFGGFLSREKHQRVKEMTQLREMKMPVILMDTPYRLTAVLQDAVKVFGKGRKATLACSLTQPDEKVHRGTLGEILQGVEGTKAEFMLVIHDYQNH
ncbi:MAG: 16S rRNA (cytidine(1402)-2'-O)-methyltransferase [Anaerolineae bacterium]|jgi:16S rRNA (cytidine1402-2'-O)-methyltransferase|nr:16S rRNA (cytidine(1402)-2'-O)-methyltransferase [Anaerolineae bacterium]